MENSDGSGKIEYAVFTMDRAVSTGDKKDEDVIFDELMKMQFAYGANHFNKHFEYGFFDLYINSETLDITAGEPVLDEISEDYLLHGLAMYICWGALITT